MHVLPIDFLERQFGASPDNEIAQNLPSVFSGLFVRLCITKQPANRIASLDKLVECPASCPDGSGSYLQRAPGFS